VLDAVPLDGSEQRIRVGLVLELRRVDAEHDQPIVELLLQGTHLV
jgi:hypothetical protein